MHPGCYSTTCTNRPPTIRERWNEENLTKIQLLQGIGFPKFNIDTLVWVTLKPVVRNLKFVTDSFNAYSNSDSDSNFIYLQSYTIECYKVYSITQLNCCTWCKWEKKEAVEFSVSCLFISSYDIVKFQMTTGKSLQMNLSYHLRNIAMVSCMRRLVNLFSDFLFNCTLYFAGISILSGMFLDSWSLQQVGFLV